MIDSDTNISNRINAMITQATAALPIIGLREITKQPSAMAVVCGYSCGRTMEERVEYIRQSCQLHNRAAGGSRCYDYCFDAERWFKAWQVQEHQEVRK